jgi:DNA polymerase
MAPPWLVLDFETFSACDLKKAGSYRYAEDPTTQVLCLAYEDNTKRRGIWSPGDDTDDILKGALDDPEVMFVAHNCSFERNIWTHHMVGLFGFPEVPLSRWHDTMARAQQLVLPAGLDDVLRVLRLAAQKDMEGSRLTVGLSRPDKKGCYPAVTPEVLHRVGLYCLQDVAGQAALHRRIGWLPAHERPIWELSQRMNDRGLRLDMELVRAMQSIVDQETGPLSKRFAELTGGLTFNQRDKVILWCADRGVVLNDMTKATLANLLGEPEEEETLADAEGDAPEVSIRTLPDDVREALHIRQLVGSASIKKLKTMEACVGLDGRARGLLRYHGTGPGRQAGQLLQPHNFPRGSLGKDVAHNIDALVAALKTRSPAEVSRVSGKPPVETVVSCLRHVLLASEGKQFLAGDYAGIQARTVLALAGQYDKVDLMASGVDVYCDMAGQIYKRVITKEDTKERAIGKNSVLGLGFQMGAPTFWLKYGGSDQTLEFCEGVVKTYRTEWAPQVPKLWRGLQAAATDTVRYGVPHEFRGVTYRLEDQWLTAHVEGMPDDCKLWYFNPQKVTRLMPWSEPGKPEYREGFTYQVKKNGHWVTRDAFGGQLTENAVMKIERELMEDAKAKLEAAGFEMVLEVHDEAVAEGLDVGAFKQIMEDIPAWAKALRVPVAVEAWSGERYRK